MSGAEIPALVQSHGHDPYVVASLQADQAGLFACDDSQLMGPYLPGYPALQPSRAADVQPSTTREEMVYPTDTTDTAFFKTEENAAHLTTPNLQASPSLLNHGAYAGSMMPVTASPTAVGYAPIGSAPESNSVLHISATSFAVSNDARGIQSASSDVLRTRFVSSNGAPPPSKRGPFKNHAVRQQTAHTRKIGSCIRCRMQRIRVRPPPPPSFTPSSLFF